MIGFLISVVVIAISLLIISKIPIGVEVDSPWIALIAGAIIGAFNSIWSWFPGWFRAANAIFSLGLIPLIGSIIVFGLAAWLVEGFRLRWGIWSAILGAIALSIVNSILFFIFRQIGLA
jgi:putative membrane protein